MARSVGVAGLLAGVVWAARHRISLPEMVWGCGAATWCGRFRLLVRWATDSDGLGLLLLTIEEKSNCWPLDDAV
ncbi:hypothetical protein ACLOJK_041953 [Asimina triloba]